MSTASVHDDRTEPRDEVFYRTRITLADHRQFAVAVVNASPHGLMLRSEADVSPGEWIRVTLPRVGEVHAAVRWTLGGRIGCKLGREIVAQDYYALLAAMRV